jgi:molybdopterin-guanine dinucleotide biosynthesis protein A
VGEVVINANQNLDRYAEFGVRVVPDALADFAGPLAGLQAGLDAATTSLVLTVPCDSPFLPADLAVRLQQALENDSGDIAVARTFGQAHPVFALVRRSLLPGLERFLAAGGRKIDAWYADLAAVEVAFDDEAEAFANINTRDELTRFEAPESPTP